MASNNEYKRYFIILQEDDKGYGMSPGKIPTGYVKIEVKSGKVRLNAFIQNVRVEDRAEYRLVLVASGKKMAVDAGKLIMDSTGRGELSCEVESDNVFKSGLSIGDFTVAAVACGDTLPLSGYTGRDKLEWKGKYEIVNRQKPQETARIDKKIKIEEIVPEIPQPAVPVKHEHPAPEPELPAKPEPIVPNPVTPIEIPVEVPEPVQEFIPENVTVPQPVVIPEVIVHESKVEVEIVLPECPPMAPMEEPCEMEEKAEQEDIHKYYYDDSDDSDESDSSDDKDRPKHHHEEDDDEEAPYYSSDMYRRLKKLVRRLRRYEPFEDERGTAWFKVGEDIYEINSVAVPYMGYMVPMGYPFITEGCGMMMDRKDYILGVMYDRKAEDDDDRRRIKHLLFGVPAVYSKRNEQYYRSRGFMEFKPHKSKGYGYFIMCLSLKNGMLCHID